MPKKVCKNITPEYLQSLYKSMPSRVLAALDAQDSEAKYWMRFDMFEVHF